MTDLWTPALPGAIVHASPRNPRRRAACVVSRNRIKQAKAQQTSTFPHSLRFRHCSSPFCYWRFAVHFRFVTTCRLSSLLTHAAPNSIPYLLETQLAHSIRTQVFDFGRGLGRLCPNLHAFLLGECPQHLNEVVR